MSEGLGADVGVVAGSFQVSMAYQTVDEYLGVLRVSAGGCASSDDLVVAMAEHMLAHAEAYQLALYAAVATVRLRAAEGGFGS